MALEKFLLSVRVCGRRAGDDVDRMIREGHYLHKWPGTAVAVFCLESKGTPVGVLTYSLPPKEIFKRYGVTLAWELSRLWVDDSMPKNTETWFIAQTINWIQRNRHDVKILVSYADPSRGHQGVIYKAANWKSDGRTDQGRKTPRFDLMCDGKKYGRASHVPKGAKVERVPRVSKFRYTYQLKPKRSSVKGEGK